MNIIFISDLINKLFVICTYVDRSMEQKCAKRKLSCDESSVTNKRHRKATDEDTVISSLSSSLSLNSDDYGTDTELIAINSNKRKHKYSHRYFYWT